MIACVSFCFCILKHDNYINYRNEHLLNSCHIIDMAFLLYMSYKDINPYNWQCINPYKLSKFRWLRNNIKLNILILWVLRSCSGIFLLLFLIYPILGANCNEDVRRDHIGLFCAVLSFWPSGYEKDIEYSWALTMFNTYSCMLLWWTFSSHWKETCFWRYVANAMLSLKSFWICILIILTTVYWSTLENIFCLANQLNIVIY